VRAWVAFTEGGRESQIHEKYRNRASTNLATILTAFLASGLSEQGANPQLVSVCFSLQLKGNVSREVSGGDRERRMLSRDCQLMGLTWLLTKNKTAYIPTVSAVLRAMLYAAHPTEPSGSGNKSKSAAPKCSPDQENMPLAVDSLQFEHSSTTSSAVVAATTTPPVVVAAALVGLVVCLMVPLF
jgi:hypothetical protein